MGLRGKIPDYQEMIAPVRVTRAQRDFLDELAQVHDVTVSEVIRSLIDDAFVRSMLEEVGDVKQ